MRKAKYILYIIVAIAAIELAVRLAVKYAACSGPERFIALVVYTLLVLAPLIIVVSIAKLFLSNNLPNTYNRATATLSAAETTKNRWTAFFALLVFSIIVLLGFYRMFDAIKQHENFELNNHGKYQKVLIKSIGYKGKGSPYAFFDYEYNNELYTGSLNTNNYTEGDSAYIIFSTQEPEIVVWADEYVLRKEK